MCTEAKAQREAQAGWLGPALWGHRFCGVQLKILYLNGPSRKDIPIREAGQRSYRKIPSIQPLPVFFKYTTQIRIENILTEQKNVWREI